MRAFLSRLNDKKADQFCSSVKKILSEHDVDCVTYGLEVSSNQNLMEGIRCEIEKCDLCVCCLTKAYSDSQGHYFPTSSNYVEDGIARSLAIPTIFFVEYGVEVNSIIASSTTYITTDGSLKDLRNRRRQISSMLQNICLAKRRYSERESTPYPIIINSHSQSLCIRDNDFEMSLLVFFGVLFVVGLCLLSKK